MKDKKCANCKKTKKISMFPKDKQQASGLKSYCKKCSQLLSKNYYYNHLEKSRLTKKKYSHSKRGLKILGLIAKRMIKKYPEKYIARYRLNNAIAIGRIKKLPCEKCNNLETEGHHEDYSKPLEVKWFCNYHHKKIHKLKTRT